jgi:hypothetical protein
MESQRNPGASFLVSYHRNKKVSHLAIARQGFYPGGIAIAFRQATNWASRQGFTEFIRGQMSARGSRGPAGKLSVAEEATAGVLGGTVSCWNHPFEVARIQQQAAAAAGEPHQSMLEVFRSVARVDGIGGLFKGIIPRVFLGIWQTLFMVTGAKVLKDYLDSPQL